MSNILIGIIAILFVYLIEIVVCFVAIRLVNKVTNKTKLDCRNTYISSIRTLHVVALIGVIYFVPLVALVICSAFNSLLIGPIILLILGSTVFVTNKIIIPVSESKHIQLVEKYYGKDSKYAKFLIEEQQKRQ